MIDDGFESLVRLGHRGYVGGQGEFWDAIGSLQYSFLLAQGLRPDHVLCDIACGSLRGGIHFIRYLNPGNYLGIEREIAAIIAGVARELGLDDYFAKRPELVVNAEFDFSTFSKKPDFVLAQSLFSHLSGADICRCLMNLRAFVLDTTQVYFTFFERASEVQNPKVSHSQLCFFYTRQELEIAASLCGWSPTYIGDWGHPRGQVMMKLDPIA